MKQGALTGLAIAFIADSFTLNRDGSRTITKLTLLEISLTPVPAQPEAQVTSVRSLPALEKQVTKQTKIGRVSSPHFKNLLGK